MKIGLRGDIYLNEPWLSVRWDGEHGCVHAEFKAFANSAEFRAGTMKILDAITDREAESLVSDNRRLELVTSADQTWINEIWTPLAVTAGLRWIAVVVSQHGLGKFASEEILREMGSAQFTTRTFASPKVAMNWVGGTRTT